MTMLSRPRTHLIERAVEAMADRGPPGATIAPAPAGLAPPEPKPRLDGEAAPLAITLEQLTTAGLVAEAGPRPASRVVEEMSVVQQQVLRGIEGASAHNSVVLVTSARPQEGKSFIALNLAASIAIAGARKVVLVDADAKRGSLTDVLGLGEARGLRGLASRPQDRPNAVLMGTAIANLAFLPFGRPEGEAADRPPSAMMAEALSRLARANPDHVLVLDTPPALSTSDASALSGIAGQVVMVVDAEATQRNEVEAALDMMEACPVLQLLLNRARLTANDSFGAYGDYGTSDAG